MSSESRRGFLGRLIGRNGDDNADSDRPAAESSEKTSTDNEDNEPDLMSQVMDTLERVGPEKKLPNETIRAITARNRKKRKSSGAGWRPQSVDPFANGAPTVRAVELAREVAERESASGTVTGSGAAKKKDAAEKKEAVERETAPPAKTALQSERDGDLEDDNE